MQKNYIKKGLIIFFLLALDLFTKAITNQKNITIIEGVLSFYSTHNLGAAWGILQGELAFFVITGVIFLVAAFVFDYLQKEENTWYTLGFCLLIAGAIGNMIDRIFLGYVRDFILLDFINFPVFNIADIAITLGCILIGVYVLFFSTKDKGKKEDN